MSYDPAILLIAALGVFVIAFMKGSFGGGFLGFALVSAGCAVAILYVARVWEGVFIEQGGVAAESEPDASFGEMLEPAEGLEAAKA